MPQTTNQPGRARAVRMRRFVGKRVTVTLTANNWTNDVLTFTGHVMAVAVRMKGTADFRGYQYDMVLDCDDRIPRVFALSRIRTIDEVA